MTEKLKDYYALLGIDVLATRHEIHAAYRKMLKVYHPDLNKELFAIKIYMEILEAYNILSDPQRRKAYDVLRKA